MISAEQYAEIRRLFFAEHWKKGTICAELGVHPEVVERAIGPLGPRPAQREPQPCLIDPYKPFIGETLEIHPRLRATRINDMIVGRGYQGSQRTVTRYVRQVRPARQGEVFVRNEPLPGEQSQVDWALVGQLPVPGGQRPLWVFVLTLSYSRAIFAELVLDQTVASLRRSLVHAAQYFGGVSRQWLFDNPKTVVLERQGTLVRFQPELLALATALHVELRLCGVRQPQHKGGVERAVRYLEERHFAARALDELDQGSAELGVFLREVAPARRHPVQHELTVAQVLEQERAHLLALPSPLPEEDQLTPVAVDTQAFVRFDRNRYSVPPEHARGVLTLVASDRQVRLLQDQRLVAEHPRCWGKGQVLELPEHRRSILATKVGGREGAGRRRLLAAVPRMAVVLEAWLHDGRHLGTRVARSVKLLDLHGQRILAAAVDALLERGSHDWGALAVLCDQLQRPARPLLPLALGDHVPDHEVVPHELGGYDD